MKNPEMTYLELTPTLKAYLAGLFDGEGSIYIQTSPEVHRKNGKQYPYKRFRVLLQCGNNDYRLVQLWKDSYGGVIHTALPRSNRKRSFAWSMTGKRITRVLLDLLPYLIHKRDKAHLALEFQSGINTYRAKCKLLGKPFTLDSEERQKRMSLVQEFKKLN